MKQLFKFSLIFSLLLWSGLVLAQESSLVTDPNIKVETQFLFPDAECTGPGELIYDDGVFENGYGWNPVVTDGRFVSLFTPTQYPWEFNTFCLALTRVAASPANFTFDIVMYDGAGGGVPGAEIAVVTGVTATNLPIWPTLAFYDFDISSMPALASGSVYIGIKYNPSLSAAPHYSGADESTSTTLHPGYAWSGTVWETIQTLFTTYRAMGYRTLGSSGPPCPVGAPTNPNPPSGTTNVPISGNTATWTNAAGTTQVELWFGPTGNLTQVYSGSPITSFALPTLNYFTTYGWYVKDKNDTCFTQGPTWTFTTVQDPNLIEWCDEFASISNWTIIGPLGLTNWSAAASGSAGGTPPELRMSWTPSFTGVSKIRSAILPVAFLNNWLTYYSFNFFIDWYANPSGSVTVAVTYDGGTTSTPIYSVVDPTGNVGPTVISGQFTTPASGTTNMQLEITYDGYSFNTDNIYWDNLCIYQIVPVELTSFTAIADYGVVELSWITATETNNQGFEVQRSAGGEFEAIAFVEGHGTTTEVQAYSYTDRSVSVGSYSYRLKQVDFDGTTSYSSIVEVDVPAPAVFALDQNYPNPFNPSTKIAFRLAVDSKVSLKIFDILGQEVAALVNTNLVAGAHNVDFDASSLNSGVYLYRIEATGIDGTNFVDVKKMILTK